MQLGGEDTAPNMQPEIRGDAVRKSDPNQRPFVRSASTVEDNPLD